MHEDVDTVDQISNYIQELIQQNISLKQKFDESTR